MIGACMCDTDVCQTAYQSVTVSSDFVISKWDNFKPIFPGYFSHHADAAQYQGKIVFGDNTMQLDSWRADLGPSLAYSITVDGDCIPNGETLVGKMTGTWGTNRK